MGKDELLFIVQPQKDTEFNRAFHNLLISAMVNKGVKVSKNGDTRALLIDVDAQLVKFSFDRYQNQKFISATAIAAGVMAVNGLHPNTTTGIGIGILGAAALLDWNTWIEREYASAETPQHELIITTSATNSVQFLARRTDVYYISDTDKRLYDPTDKTMKITGGV